MEKRDLIWEFKGEYKRTWDSQKGERKAPSKGKIG